MKNHILSAGIIGSIFSEPAKAQEWNELSSDLMAAAFPAAIFLIGILALVSIYFYRLYRRNYNYLEHIYPLYSHYASEAYFFWDAKQDREAVSIKLIALLTLPVTSNRLSNIMDALEPESASQLQEACSALKKVVDHSMLAEEDPEGFTLTVQNKKQDGTRHYFEVDGKALRDTKGYYTAIYLGFRDITKPNIKRNRLDEQNQQLSEELQRYIEMLNAAPFPIFQRDVDLHIQYCNDAYKHCVNSSENDSQSPDSINELGKNAQDIAKKALHDSRPHTEQQHIIVNGERKLYEITEVPSKNNQTLYGFGIDKSDVEKLQSDLHLNISAQNCLLESSASAMALYGFDKRLKSYNNAFVSLWDLDENWLTTQPTYGEVLEAQREKRKLPEQANFPAFKKRHLKFFSDLIEPHNEFFYLPDGTALRVIVIPHALGGLLFAYEDMTDRLAIERSYNTLIAVQRATLNNLHEGVAVFGQNGRIKLFNPMYAKMWHLSTSMLESEPHMSHILEHTRHLYKSGNDWQTFKEHIITQSTNRQPSEQCFERTDGVVLDWVSVPLPDGATLMTYIDITDSTLVERSLRERNEALQGADRIKTEFLANVSYELRSPLTTIVGYAQLLEEEKNRLSPKHQEYVQDIRHSSNYLMALINDVLDLASIEAGHMTLNATEVDVYQLLLSVMPLINSRVKENNLSLHLECDDNIGTMIADDKRIKQLIFKLLSNAIKFTQEGGSIRYGANNIDDDELVIWVQDTGMGIPLEEHEAVFEKFYKVTKAQKRNSGTGLGLSVVKNFVALHGGYITVQSSPGEGARFNCYFKRYNTELLQNDKMISFSETLAS